MVLWMAPAHPAAYRAERTDSGESEKERMTIANTTEDSWAELDGMPADAQTSDLAARLSQSASCFVVHEREHDAMSAIGHLWNLSVVGPFIASSVQMTKLIRSQR